MESLILVGEVLSKVEILPGIFSWGTTEEKFSDSQDAVDSWIH